MSQKLICFWFILAVLRFSEWAPKLVPIFFIIFGLNFGLLFFGVLDFLGVFWEPSWASKGFLEKPL